MKSIFKTLLFSGITVFITFSLIKFPDPALEASIRGLNLWWEVVFPSLLPFFIAAELLISFGVVKFVGVLFEPIMRPLFNIPGVGSFGWMMGMASGYPTGAKIAARLREENQVSKVEAERLVSFTNNSSPLFIFGALSVGFFHDPKIGVLLATCHYVGNAIVGFIMRFYKKNDEHYTRDNKKTVSLKRAFKEMHETRLRDKRPFGEVLGDAVLNSIKTLVMVGGFIVLFSVLIKILFLVGVSSLIAGILGSLLSIASLPADYGLPLLSGLFEITIGADMISKITTDSIFQQVILISFILGFNGFSIQAQVASILAKTDISFKPYFFARILHGTIASLLAIILYKPLYLDRQVAEMKDMPVSGAIADNIWVTFYQTIQNTGPLITIVFLGIAALIIFKKHVKKDAA